MSSKKIASFSVREKQQICLYSNQWPTKSQQQIANHFSTLWQKPIARRTAWDILQKKEKWLADTTNLETKKFKTAKHETLEKALFLWFTSARAKNIPITSDILRQKAMEFGAQLEVGDFNY